MNIKEFEKGDVITRNEPMTYKHSGDADGSWLGDPFIFKGVDEEAKMFFLEHNDGPFKGDSYKMSFARDAWNEGWCYYPKTLEKEAIKKSNFLTRLFSK